MYITYYCEYDVTILTKFDASVTAYLGVPAPSVRPSVCLVRAADSKTKGLWKIKNDVKVTQGTSNHE